MKTHILLALMLLLVPLAHADLVTTGAALDASLLYYEPVPAQPGDAVDIWIQITNDGGSRSKTGMLSIQPSSTFTVEAGSDERTAIPGIPGQESFLFTTTVRISKDANEGTSYIKVRIQEDGKESYIERDLAINIQGTSSALSILKATTSPADVLPGEHTLLSVVVQNVGQTVVRNVDVALDLDDLSFAPSGSSDSKTISSLRGGESHTFVFNLAAYPDAEANAYQLPITLSYDDEQGNAKSQDETIGIVVGSQPELLVYFDRVGITADSGEGEVVIQFVNKGLSEIKLLEMEVIETDDVKVTSESSLVYVGNIEEDDYESADIDLSVKGDDVMVSLRVAYKDALNKDYETEYQLPLKLKSGNGGSSGMGWVWFVLIVGGIAGIWYWRRRKKSKRKK
ncbi:hypothetical protein GOV11_00570 [Candidatus Woesearchaeota archaeon]|nr:hypothetical protein [Candidatus Woesearchaeota archaeon]